MKKITSVRLCLDQLSKIKEIQQLINPRQSKNSTIEYLIDLGIREIEYRMAEQINDVKLNEEEKG